MFEKLVVVVSKLCRNNSFVIEIRKLLDTLFLFPFPFL